MYYQIQIRRGTASEWTATNPILAAGELAVESDTNKMKVGNGSTAWNSLAYATATPTQLNLKADLASPTFTGTVTLPSTTSIGTVSSTEIGYVDGVTSAIQTQLDSKLTATTAVTSNRNMVVNGDFKIWQRGTSFSNPANGSFTADRWFMYYDGTGATRTISQQTFTGDNPTGLNVSNYMRVAITVAGTGSGTNGMFSRIEDVRKLNNQTVTLSFYGKADASRTVNWQTYQQFGTGGSGSVQANTTNFSFTSSWQRFSVSFTMPSVSGKTITSDNSVSFIVAFPVNATGTFDITGIQLEAGAVATPFEFEDYGTTLAKCQRYFETQDWSINTWRNAVVYASGSAAAGYFMYQPKRTTPSFSWSSNGSARYIYHNGNIGGSQTLSASYSSYNGSSFNTSGTFAFSSGWVDNAGTLSISSEL